MALEFKIDLTGNFAGALEKGNHALGETTKHAHEAEKAFEAFEGELGKVRTGAATLNFNAFQEGGKFLQFDLAEGAAIAYEMIERLVDKVVDLGKEIIGVAGATEDLNLALKLDVGVEGAEEIERLTQSFEGTSRFSGEQIKGALLPLLEEGGHKDEKTLDDIATAATDVAARRKTGVAGVASALEAFKNLELQPGRARGALKELAIKQADYYKDLGALTGLSAKEAEKQMKEGKFKSETLLSVALHQIAEREGGALGKATLEAGNTLGATLERIHSLPEVVFAREAGQPGIKTLQHALDGIVETLKGPIGDKAMHSVDRLFGAIGSFVDRHDEKIFEAIAGALDSVSNALDGNNESWNQFVDVMASISHAAGAFLDFELAVRSAILGAGRFLWNLPDEVGAALNKTWETLKAYGVFLYEASSLLGKMIWQGIVDGIKAGFQEVMQAVDDMAESAITAAKRALMIHSPSAAFHEIGVYTSEGYARGVRSSEDMVGDAVSQSIAGRAIAETASGGYGAGATLAGGVHLTIGDVVIQVGGGYSAADGEQIGTEAGQALRAELGKWLDEAHAEMGVG